jgi:hypothetical protein
MVLIEIDSKEYPLFDDMPDVEGYIRNLLYREHSILKSQHSPQVVKDVVLNLQNTIETIQDAIETEQQKNSSTMNSVLQKLSLLMANSSKKGSITENLGDEIFNEHLCKNTYSVINTAKTPNSADRRISKGDFEILFDWKCYSKTVPAKEVDKLKRDMEFQDVRCGIIASVDTSVSKYSNTDIEFFDDTTGRLCCLMVLGKVKDCPMKVIMGIYFMESLWKHTMLKTPTESVKVKSQQDFSDILEATNSLLRIVEIHKSHKDSLLRSIDEFQSKLSKEIHTYVGYICERLRV